MTFQQNNNIKEKKGPFIRDIYIVNGSNNLNKPLAKETSSRVGLLKGYVF